MEKPSLILCAAEYDAPLDVRDEVKSFRHPDDIVEHINILSLEITDHLEQADPARIDSSTLLQSLSIGDPTAENEMTTLGTYYLRTDQYSRAVRGEVNLVVGRVASLGLISSNCRSRTPMVAPPWMMSARWTTLSSSRTFPGQR